MKKTASLILLVLGTSSCVPYIPSQMSSDNIISQTYVHKYGIEMDGQEWISRGKDGQILTTLTDGTRRISSYSKGILDGETTYTFPHSHIIMRRDTYSEGTLVKSIYNTPAGTLQKEIFYISPTSTKIKEYFDNSATKCIEEYEEEALVFGEYFDRDSKMCSCVNQGSGIRSVRDFYGHLEYRDMIENGEVIKKMTFYPSGTPKTETPYVNGLIEGTRKLFAPTGEPEAIETWSKNKREGITILYQNGGIIAEVPYSDGVKEGIELRYNDERKVVEEISWSHGLRHGLTITHIGDVRRTQWYYKGKPITKNHFDEMKTET
ncbi:MAG: toxin-antitoxin system YwqK family antitoxin [Chlamydiales bacterium]